MPISISAGCGRPISSSRVGAKSVLLISQSLARPFSTPRGQWTMNGTRMPPSSVCRFEPRSGALTAPFTVVPSLVGPPLSLMKKISVRCSRSVSRNLASTE